MAIQVIAWQCEYCGDIKKTKYIADRHETACLDNPDGRNCLRCIHSYMETGDITTDSRDKGLHCSIRGSKCTRAMSANCDQYERKTNE